MEIKFSRQKLLSLKIKSINIAHKGFRNNFYSMCGNIQEKLSVAKRIKIKTPLIPTVQSPDSNRGQLRIRRKAGSNQWARDFLIKATEVIRSFLNAISFLFFYFIQRRRRCARSQFSFFLSICSLPDACGRALFCCFKATFWLLALVKVALPSTALAPCGLRRRQRSLTRVQFNVSPKLKRGRDEPEREQESRSSRIFPTATCSARPNWCVLRVRLSWSIGENTPRRWWRWCARSTTSFVSPPTWKLGWKFGRNPVRHLKCRNLCCHSKYLVILKNLTLQNHFVKLEFFLDL